MVRGSLIAVTAVPCVYQCAEIARIAFGRGSVAPMFRQTSVYAFSCSALIGLPCPKKIAGMRIDVVRFMQSSRFQHAKTKRLIDSSPSRESLNSHPQSDFGWHKGAWRAWPVTDQKRWLRWSL